MDKTALARRLLRALGEKRAGIALPLIAGATLAGGVHTLGKGLRKSREYKAGFTPEINDQGSH